MTKMKIAGEGINEGGVGTNMAEEKRGILRNVGGLEEHENKDYREDDHAGRDVMFLHFIKSLTIHKRTLARYI